MASEKIIEQKKKEVSELAAKINEAKVVLLTDYRGISVADVTDLRTKLREKDVEYKVIKNNITRRALEECKIEGLEDACKTIYEYAKDNDFYKIKGGIIDGKVMTAEEIITLAKLPSKETLLSMLAGALLGTISKFAVALEQVRLQKEANA